MMDPPIEMLMDKVNSRFALVTVSARRARQINSYFNQLGEGLGAIVPPQVASVSRKPLSIALEEIVSEKITFTPLNEDDKVPAVSAVTESPVVEAVADEPATEGQD
jgi:DNA-directed RNA polymerase subunit omega